MNNLNNDDALTNFILQAHNSDFLIEEKSTNCNSTSLIEHTENGLFEYFNF